VTALRSLLPRGGRALVIVDLLVALWVAAWIVLALALAHEVRGLRQLSETATKAGMAIRDTGQSLQSLSSVPFVGDRIGDTAREIDEVGRSTIESGAQSRESVHNLSWMLAVFVGVIPSVPVLVMYLPLRVYIARNRHGPDEAAAP
jgi:hypothetical protein